VIDASNRARFRPDARAVHLESWFTRLNEPNGRRALWLKWTIFADRVSPPRAESWAVAFERGKPPRGAKRSLELTERAVSDDPFRLAFGETTFDGTHAEGRVATASTDIVFGVDLAASIPPLLFYPEWMYTGPIPETKSVTPMPDGRARGFYVLDGERIDMTGWRAMQGHNWGRGHVHRYVWCHGFGFDGANDVVFEGASARIHRGVELRWFSGAHLRVDGRWHRFNDLSALARSRTDARVMQWHFSTRNEEASIEVEAVADREETAALIYVNPRGAVTNCLNSKLGTLRVTLRDRDRVRSWETHQAAFEIGWPSADHGIVVVA
jgi:hypothetical protein